jgi:hypothetical protein
VINKRLLHGYHREALDGMIFALFYGAKAAAMDHERRWHRSGMISIRFETLSQGFREVIAWENVRFFVGS